MHITQNFKNQRIIVVYTYNYLLIKRYDFYRRKHIFRLMSIDCSEGNPHRSFFFRASTYSVGITKNSNVTIQRHANFHTMVRSSSQPPITITLNLSSVIDTIEQSFRSPQTVRIVKLEQVNALARIRVRPNINFTMTFPSIYRYYARYQWSTTL